MIGSGACGACQRLLFGRQSMIIAPMDVHQDSALTIMAAVLVILLWMAAWTWIRFARRPDEQRENVGYAMAAVLGYAGLLLAYVVII